MHLERRRRRLRRALRDRRRDGLRDPGDPVDVEAHHRGESLYGGSTKIPLHPQVLSEGAASLLPDQVRPAFLWTIRLDATGEIRDARVERARVRSRQRLDYAGHPAGDRSGTRRLDAGAARGGREAPAGQGGRARRRVAADARAGHRRGRRPVAASTSGRCCRSRAWNAQISLLTGFAAASIMLEGKVGVLRTLPPAAGVRGQAAAPHGARAGPRLAELDGAPGVHPLARPGASRRRRDDGGVHRAAPRRRVRRLRRPPARPDRARRAGLVVRPRDGAAAAAGRPLRPGGVRRAVRRAAGARLGARRPARPAAADAGLRSQGPRLRARRARPGRGADAAVAGGGALRGRRAGDRATTTSARAR